MPLFVYFSPEISRFISLRQDFGKHLLLGDYPNATSVLSEIRYRFGWSKWLIERELMLAQFGGGLGANKIKLQEILSESRDAYVSLFASMTSYRLEEHVSPEKYEENKNAFIAEQRKNPEIRKSRVIRALLQRNIPGQLGGWENEAASVLLVEGGGAVLDAYLTAKTILSMFSDKPLSNPSVKIVEETLKNLGESIKDPQLRSIAVAYGVEPPEIIDPRTDSLQRIQDEFESGDFESTFASCLAAITECPLTFEYYWIAAKALAYSDSNKLENTLPRSRARDLLGWMCDVSSFSDGVEISMTKSKQFALKVGDCGLASEIRLRLLWEANRSPSSSEVAYARCQARHAALLTPDFWQKTLNSADNSVVMGKQFNPTRDSFSVDCGCGNTPRCSRLAVLREASLLSRERDYRKALQVLENLEPSGLEKFNGKRRFEGIHCALLFNVLIGLKSFESAANIAISAYLLNPTYLRYVDLDDLSDYLQTLCQDGSALVAVLFFLKGEDAQSLYRHFDNWLIQESLAFPTQALPQMHTLERPVARLLLRDIMVMRVLSRGVLYASSTSELRSMRSQILRFAYKEYPEDRRAFLDEVASLEKQSMLEGSRNLVESNIFSFDFEELNTSYLAPSFAAQFQRYLAYKDLEEGLKEIGFEGEANLFEGKVKLSSGGMSTTLLSVFAEVFNPIMLQYLWNPELGLNSVLSTRIRHGAIDNNLLRSFGRTGILVSGRQDGISLPVIDSVIDEEMRGEVTKVLQTLTAEVNSTLDWLKSTILRISFSPEIIRMVNEILTVPEGTLAAEGGVFDYSFVFEDGGSLLKLFQEVSTIDEFIAKCEEIFREKTAERLEAMARIIRVDVSAKIRDAIRDCESKLSRIALPNDARTKITKALRDTEGELQVDLTLVSGWFKLGIPLREKKPLKDFVLHAVHGVNRSTNEGLGEFSINIEIEAEVPWAEGLRFYDVVSTLLRNVVFHSTSPPDDRYTSLDLRKQGGVSILEVRSSMLGDGELPNCVSLANEKLQLEGEELPLALGLEGGMGLRKALSILRSFSKSGEADAKAYSKIEEEKDLFCVQFRY